MVGSGRGTTRRKRSIPIAHVIIYIDACGMYAGFLTDRHWTIVRNFRLRRALLIGQLKASSNREQFIENNRIRSRL